MALKLKLLTSIGLAIFCLALIAWVNYIQIADWFAKNGPANLGSIEVSYVSMARFIIDFGLPIGPFGSSWAPFWYFGFPFHLFYTPLLPLLEVVVHKTFGLALWESYRFLTGIAYILAPISVFALGWQLSKRVIGGLIAGMLFSVGPTIFYFLDPGVAADKFSIDFWDPRRFTILVRWGEGPHVFSLVFVPLVGLFFSRYLESLSQKRHSESFDSAQDKLRRGILLNPMSIERDPSTRPSDDGLGRDDKKGDFVMLLLASIFLGLAGLTNPIGFFASIIFIGAIAFVKFAQDHKTRFLTLKSILTVGALTFGLISFWYNLSFVSSFFKEGSGTGSLLISLFPWGWIGILVGVFVIYLLISKVIRNFGVACSMLLFLIFFGVVACYYLSAPPEESYRRIEILPQALRYNVEADLSSSLLIGVLFAWLVGYLGKKSRVLEIAGNGVGILGVVGLLWYIQAFIPVASKATGTVVDIKNTGEYDIAMWLKDHVDEKKGERVFIPGNYGFYLNYFTNVWQHRGGLFQAATHKWPDHMHYQLSNGKDAEIAHAWLVASNIKYAVIPTIVSRELYKEIKNQERFLAYNGAYNKNGDIIYQIPLKRPSLAKPVSISAMKLLKEPKKADDKKRLIAYSSWLEDSSARETSFSVVDNDTYRIKGEVGEGEGILVQMTADSGWTALLRQPTDQGKLQSVKTGRDPLGFLVLYPPAGEVDIALKHGRIWQEWLGYLITIGTVGFIVKRGIKK